MSFCILIKSDVSKKLLYYSDFELPISINFVHIVLAGCSYVILDAYMNRQSN